MTGKDTPLPEEPPTLREREVVTVWETFRGGQMVHCPKDSGPLALSVDGSAKSYRFICTTCGLASRWFGVTSEGLVMRGQVVRFNESK